MKSPLSWSQPSRQPNAAASETVPAPTSDIQHPTLEDPMGDFSFSFKKAPGAKPPAAKNKFEAAENQFNAIRGCGVSPYPKVTLDTLTKGQEPGAFEEAPFALMLALMGGTNEKDEPRSDDVWCFPPAC